MGRIHFLFLFFCSNASSWNFENNTAIIFKPTNESGSYFGYSVAIYEKNQEILALITATKANSTGIKRSGTLYNCKITNNKCEKIDIETANNGNYEEDMWLGVSLDVQSKKNGLIVTCGHLYKLAAVDAYLPTGACYILNGELKQVEKIQPFDKLEGKFFTSKTAFSQAGISAYFKEDDLLIGSPGYETWRGDVVRYTFRNNMLDVKNPFIFNLRAPSFVSYIGYSVSSGKFFKNSELMYVSGAPRDGNYMGKVYIFDELSIVREINGDQIGEYFGASILCVDVNNDKLTDLLVGAPMYSTYLGEDEGRVYVFLSNGIQLDLTSSLYGSSNKRSRFGTSLAYIGDINHDKFSDIAVGAPYESEKGAIYIYHGSSEGIKSEFVQRIFAEEISKSLKGFGISISKPKDVDSNNYPDILVGSFLSDNAVLLRTRPIVRVSSEIEFDPPQLNSDNPTCNLTDLNREGGNNFNIPCFKILYCINYEGKYVPDKINFTIELHSFRLGNVLLPREYFMNQNRPSSFIRGNIIIKANERKCFFQVAYIRGDFDDFITPIQIKANVSLEHDTSKDTTFCKDCPVLDPTSPRTKSEMIKYQTGCKRDKCHSDLKLKVYDYSPKEIILGKESSITIITEVQKVRDPAYKTELKIHLPENMKFISGENCRISLEFVRKFILICHIGNPFNKQSIKHKVKLDTSKISASVEEIYIFLNLTTQSEEINPNDNVANITIPIKLSADISIIGRTDQEQIVLKNNDSRLDLHGFTHTYNVMKYLYSPISSVTVNLFIPTNLTGLKDRFVNIESVKIIHLDHSISVSGYCNFINMEKVDGNNEIDSKNFTLESRQKRSVNNKVVSKDLNPVFNCKTAICENVMCSIGPFDQNRKSATIQLKGFINVKVLESALKKWDNITFSSKGKVSIDDKRLNIQPVDHLPDETEVVTFIVRSISLKRGKIAKWILPVSLACGIVLVTIILVALLKMGFFRRKNKEKVENLKADLQKRQSCYENEIDAIDEN